MRSASTICGILAQMIYSPYTKVGCGEASPPQNLSFPRRAGPQPRTAGKEAYLEGFAALQASRCVR